MSAPTTVGWLNGVSLHSQMLARGTRPDVDIGAEHLQILRTLSHRVATTCALLAQSLEHLIRAETVPLEHRVYVEMVVREAHTELAAKLNLSENVTADEQWLADLLGGEQK